MKTRVKIVQELLDSRSITAEDALVLLTKEIEFVSYPNQYTTFTMPHYINSPSTGEPFHNLIY